MVGGLIQVLLAIGVVIVLFVIAFFVFNMELLKALQNASKKTKDVEIFSGIIDFATTRDISYNTRNTAHPAFRDVAPSYNQQSGAEFTYNFWLYSDLDDVFGEVNRSTLQNTDSGISSDDLVLVLKGNKDVYTYRNVCNKNKNDVLVKCPLIKLQRGGDVLTVEFNTFASPDGVREQAMNTCNNASTDWKYMNAHKLAVSGLRFGPNSSNYAKKWYMVTVVIQDTNPSDPLPMRNKCRCRIFINGTVELDRYVDGALGSYESHNPSVLRINQSNLHVAPVISNGDVRTFTVDGDQKTRKLMMADLTYYNYAVDPAAIVAKFKGGFNKSFAPVTSGSVDDPLAGANVDSLSYSFEKRQLQSF